MKTLGKIYRPRRAHSRAFFIDHSARVGRALVRRQELRFIRDYRNLASPLAVTAEEAETIVKRDPAQRFDIGSRSGCLSGWRIEGNDLAFYGPSHGGGNGYGPCGEKRSVYGRIVK